MKPKVQRYGRVIPSLEQQLAETFALQQLVDQPDPKAFLAARGVVGALQLLCIPCRWRSDGVLQYLGTRENYERPSVQARPETGAVGPESELGATECAIADEFKRFAGLVRRS